MIGIWIDLNLIALLFEVAITSFHLTPLSGTVFRALSHALIHFVYLLCSFKTTSIEASDYENLISR